MHCEKQRTHFAVTLEIAGSNSLTGQTALIRLAQVVVHAAGAEFESQALQGFALPLSKKYCVQTY